MKVNLNPQSQNAMLCILFLAISLMFFACGTISEGNQLLNQDPPANVRAEANSMGGITISWNSVSGADGYYIYRDKGNYTNGPGTGTYTQVGTSSTTSYTDNFLSSGTYYYKVAAYKSKYGAGPWSSYDSATIVPLPNTPSSVTAMANSISSITVSWNSVSGATGYYIYSSTSASGTYIQVSTSSTTQYTNNSLSESTTYYYKVAAYNSSGIGSQSSYAYARTMTTQCDNQIFKTVTIGTQTWMAENLNCNVNGSKCYDDDDGFCDIYGRLYNWATAMNLDTDCNSSYCNSQVQSKHKGICPSGWHIPNYAEWETLVNYVGEPSTAGRYLKAKSGWYNCGPYDSGNYYLCEDTYGFVALPGGHGDSDGSFIGAGSIGRWWGTHSDNDHAISTLFYNYEERTTNGGYSNKSYLLSIRCVKD